MEADRVWRFAEFAARLGLDSLSGGIRWERSGKMVSNQARENNEEMQREPLVFQHLREEAPNPKQIEFFTAKEKHVCYGGARGGGKSWAMRRRFVLLAINYPGLKLLLLRRTMPELRRNHIIPLMGELAGFAKYNGEAKTFIFPNGSRLELGYCDNEGDVSRYQGAEYDVVGFEEATLFPEEWIVMITTSVRTTRRDWQVRFYYTCNPGGVGHAYIKRLFIDRRYKEGERPEDYRFIRATVLDNKVLMEADPGYIDRLRALPPAKRRAHLEGDWSVYEGQVFEEFTDDPAHYHDRKWTHVIEPFEVPPQWRIYRSFDFGYARPFSVGWWAVDYDNRLYRILELYGCVPDEPNTGLRWEPGASSARFAVSRTSTAGCRASVFTGWRTPASGIAAVVKAWRRWRSGSGSISIKAIMPVFPGGCRCITVWLLMRREYRSSMFSAPAANLSARFPYYSMIKSSRRT